MIPVLPQHEAIVTVRMIAGIPVVEVVGDLELSDLRGFEAGLQRATRSGAADVIVSLAETEYFNSGGMRVLIRVAEQLGHENRRLLLVAPSDRTPRRLLDIVYLTSHLLPFESVDEAVEAITAETPAG